MDTLTAPIPDADMEVSIDPKVNANEFNDGYEQVVGVGAYNVRREFPVKWTNLKYDEATAIISFFEAKRGATKFLWTAPEESQRVFICTKFSYKWKFGRRCDITAFLKEQAG